MLKGEGSSRWISKEHKCDGDCKQLGNSLCRFYPFRGCEDHHEAVDEDGGDDDEGEQGVD